MHQLLASLLSHLSANEDGCTLLIKGGDFLTGCEKGLRDMGLGGGGTAKARDVPRQAALLQSAVEMLFAVGGCLTAWAHKFAVAGLPCRLVGVCGQPGST